MRLYVSRYARIRKIWVLLRKERYRVRQGVYRIVYEIQDKHLIVLVIKVAHRSEVYKSS